MLTLLQYLLQGSLILLLLADKLSTETNDGVLRACEIIVRAHEAAVVTLNTEYQVSLAVHSAAAARTDTRYREISERL